MTCRESAVCLPDCAYEPALCQPRPWASYFLKDHEDLKRLDDSLEVTHSGMENGTEGGDKGPVSFPS